MTEPTCKHRRSARGDPGSRPGAAGRAANRELHASDDGGPSSGAPPGDDPFLSPTLKPLPTVRAALWPSHRGAIEFWLVEGLWMREAVAIDGEPKCGKSFLALDLAVAGQPRSLAKGGERRSGIHRIGGSAPQVTAEQLAIRCAVRVRKYGASNKS